VSQSTAIEAHTPAVLSVSSQSVRCHKELRPDAGILMPFGALGYKLVHQSPPHSRYRDEPPVVRTVRVDKCTGRWGGDHRGRPRTQDPTTAQGLRRHPVDPHWR
jgi:hypothetical protein